MFAWGLSQVVFEVLCDFPVGPHRDRPHSIRIIGEQFTHEGISDMKNRRQLTDQGDKELLPHDGGGSPEKRTDGFLQHCSSFGHEVHYPVHSSARSVPVCAAGPLHTNEHVVSVSAVSPLVMTRIL